MTVSSIELERSQQALESINALKTEPCGKYASYVKGLPAAILQNGLGQALATLLARAKRSKPNRSPDEKACEKLYEHLETWLCRDNEHAPYPRQRDLMKAITTHNEDHYLRAQAEALAYLNWLKKFAVAYLQQSDSEV